jgi:hypothetical protein
MMTFSLKLWLVWLASRSRANSSWLVIANELKSWLGSSRYGNEPSRASHEPSELTCFEFFVQLTQSTIDTSSAYVQYRIHGCSRVQHWAHHMLIRDRNLLLENILARNLPKIYLLSIVIYTVCARSSCSYIIRIDAFQTCIYGISMSSIKLLVAAVQYMHVSF